jgi:DNA-binding NarL/FixJ family response regulator
VEHSLPPRKIDLALLRILVADDYEVVQKGVCSMLESRGDLQVCGEAPNGEEAVQKAIQRNPDLIVLGAAMPALNGFSATKQIKEILPSIPILMLSMLDGPEIVRAAQLAGAQGFVTKVEAGIVLLKAWILLFKGGLSFRVSNSSE